MALSHLFVCLDGSANSVVGVLSEHVNLANGNWTETGEAPPGKVL